MDWVAISQVATAAGTLVLAVATFGSIRSAKRSTDLAERTLLAGLRPLLVPSRDEDPPERVRFGDGRIVIVDGHAGVIELDPATGGLYMAISLRNGGAGIAVIHGWALSADTGRAHQPSAAARFRAQQRDLYVPAGERGFWQGAIRDPSDPDAALVREAIAAGRRIAVDLLYGDHQGGQRTSSRFAIGRGEDEEGSRAEMVRVWALDGPDPRRG